MISFANERYEYPVHRDALIILLWRPDERGARNLLEDEALLAAGTAAQLSGEVLDDHIESYVEHLLRRCYRALKERPALPLYSLQYRLCEVGPRRLDPRELQAGIPG